MKALDHDSGHKDDWFFVFVRRYRELRPEIGKKCAKTYAISDFNKLKDLLPIRSAEKWFKEPQ
jgi:hypothetical protein